MKKVIVGLFFMFSSPAAAEFHFFAGMDRVGNPLFGDKESQIMINLGQGVNQLSLIAAPDMPVPFGMIGFQYSQPVSFFRLPARMSINAIQTVGWGQKYQYDGYVDDGTIQTFIWDWTKYQTQLAMLSVDCLIAWTSRWYFGSGLAIGVQGKENMRIGTKFLTGFKIFAGYAVAENWRIEMFMQHYSNGSTDLQNYSYNFIGIGAGYNF